MDGLRYVAVFISVLLVGCSSISNTKSELSQRHFPSGTQEISIPPVTGVRSDLLKNIAPVVQKSIADGYYPGVVILAVHKHHLIYRGVFGSQRIVPDQVPMHFNTLFDVASLTKVVATTPAIMQLIEQGKLDLDEPVAKYWPRFAQNGKGVVTVRELLTHTSGLLADLPDNSSHFLYSNSDAGVNYILHAIEQLKLSHPPGSTFVYSDINFVILAHLVKIITGERLEVYAQNHIFKPLGMNNTFFKPAENLRNHIAPTEILNQQLRWGKVHDFTAYTMGGVSGNAGLFSDAHDLNLYAQCLLNHGQANNKYYILGPLTVLKMETPQSLTGPINARALGWDIDSTYSNRGVLFPITSFGHTGWTGTSIWIDPNTQTSLIILASRTHPVAATYNQLAQDRRIIANIIAASLTDIRVGNKTNTGVGELSRAYSHVR